MNVVVFNRDKRVLENSIYCSNEQISGGEMSSAVIYPKSWIPYNVRTLLCRFFFDVWLVVTCVC